MRPQSFRDQAHSSVPARSLAEPTTCSARGASAIWPGARKWLWRAVRALTGIKRCCAFIEKSSGCVHTSVAIHNKKRPGSLVIPFLVSPLWARLTRLLRHPHTLRTVQSPKPAPRNWRVVAIPSTTYRPTRGLYAMQWPSWRGPPRLPVSREFQGSKENANYQMDVDAGFVRGPGLLITATGRRSWLGLERSN